MGEIAKSVEHLETALENLRRENETLRANLLAARRECWAAERRIGTLEDQLAEAEGPLMRSGMACDPVGTSLDWKPTSSAEQLRADGADGRCYRMTRLGEYWLLYVCDKLPGPWKEWGGSMDVESLKKVAEKMERTAAK